MAHEIAQSWAQQSNLVGMHPHTTQQNCIVYDSGVQTHILTVQNKSVGRPFSLSETCREILTLPLPSFLWLLGNLWYFLACSYITPDFPSVPFGVLWAFRLFSYKIFSHSGERAHLIPVQPHFNSLHLQRHHFPSKVALKVLGAWISAYHCRGHSSTHNNHLACSLINEINKTLVYFWCIFIWGVRVLTLCKYTWTIFRGIWG